jgi:hypothetical protein
MSDTYYRIDAPGFEITDYLKPEFQFSSTQDESDIRHGKSAFSNLDSLLRYWATTGLPCSIYHRLTIMEGHLSDDDDMDADLGAVLVIPTAIISCETLADEHHESIMRYAEEAGL